MKSTVRNCGRWSPSVGVSPSRAGRYLASGLYDVEEVGGL